MQRFTRPGAVLTERGQALLGWSLALIGFALLARVLLVQGIYGDGGGGGIDAHAYWAAARAALDGRPLYTGIEGTFGAYAYPPVFAQALGPLSLLPLPAFVWLWRGLELLALRVAVGSWKRTGWALYFPPILAELDAGNVHLVMAAVGALAMRGRALPLGPALMLKLASLPLLPLGWVRDRRGLVLGGLAAGAVAAVSYLADPMGWQQWLGFLGRSTIPSGMHNLAEAIPLPVRVAIALALGVAATRWVRLAPVALVLVYPVVWINALSTLVALFAPVPRHLGAAAKTEAVGRSEGLATVPSPRPATSSGNWAGATIEQAREPYPR